MAKANGVATPAAPPQAHSDANPGPSTLVERLAFDDAGLVPAVVQDRATGDVLMVAWMNAEAVTATLAEGRTVFWSRSRGQLWRKGETSGHVQHVRDLRIDCDADTLLVTVDQDGVACHTGHRSCFHRRPADLVADHEDGTGDPAPGAAPDPAASHPDQDQE